VKAQLDAGVDVNAKDHNGMTALHFAADHDQAAVAGLLISRGADLEARSNGGHTPLTAAVQSLTGGRGVAEVLLDHGADVGGGAPPGRQPLDLALVRGDADMADLLRRHGASREGEDLMRRLGLI
jgi:ankyrin repeat protein